MNTTLGAYFKKRYQEEGLRVRTIDHPVFHTEQDVDDYIEDLKTMQAYIDAHITKPKEEAETMKKDTFPEMFDLLDQLKQRWYLLKFISERPSEYGGLSRDASSALTELDQNVRAVAALITCSGDPAVKADQLRGYTCFKGLAFPCQQEQLLKVSEAILEQYSGGDDPFYVDAGYGNYWNEVPLPGCIEECLTSYIKAIQPMVPGLIGLEEPDMDIPEGAWGLSLYDLSDTMLVFKDRESLDAFPMTGDINSPAKWDGAWYF